MKNSKLYKPLLSGLLTAIFLTGFTGEEKYVELDGYLNGRSSAAFANNNRNIRTVLAKGTRGSILGFKKLPSGNFGLKIKVLNGPKTGETLWVYHKVKDSDLTLYKAAPQEGHFPMSTNAIDQAQTAVTIRNTQARVDQSPGPSPAQTAVALINRSAQKLNTTMSDVCRSCDTVAAAKERPLLRAPRGTMANACSDLMDPQGELGPQGQALYSVMAEPDYARHFTADNALGGFCPKFNELNDREKLTAWTWFWTSLAMEESSCNATQIHATTFQDRKGVTRVLNPREGFGYWALERDRNIRSWRGEACSRIGTPEGQARCAIDIMKKTQLAKGISAVSKTASYWGPIRRGSAQLIPHMKRLSLCF